MPETWLEPFPAAGLWHWDAACGRLRVQHPEHFLMLDVPQDDSGPRQQLQDVLQAYSATSAVELRQTALCQWR